MKSLIFLKLGGSLITDKTKPYTLEEEIIKRLSKEIKEAREEKRIDLIIGHGGGSFPHISAKRYKTNKGFIDKNSKYGFCQVQNDAATLNRIVVKNLLAVKENAFSVNPSSCSLAKNSEIEEFYLKVVNELLKEQILSVIYGDAVIDTEKGCTILSTEKIFLYLAKKIKPKRIIIADKTGGVHTSDPFKDKEAKIIKEVNRNNWEEVKGFLSGSNGIDVTGGMKDKVEKCIELSKLGIKVNIINGRKPNEVKKALLGEELGTRISW
jgi:isopentenyl phosphate kinase